MLVRVYLRLIVLSSVYFRVFPWLMGFRRADDAYSARAWLAEQPYVDAKRIAVIGMSNGGRTVLAALRTTLKHADRFVAAIALYPGCQTDVRRLTPMRGARSSISWRPMASPGAQAADGQ